MRRTTRRNDVLVSERRKLAGMVPALVEDFGLRCNGSGSFHQYTGWSDRYQCEVRANVYLGLEDHGTNHVWMPCRFEADDPDTIEILRDRHDVGWSLKCNCHIFDRMTAHEIYDCFYRHLCSLGVTPKSVMQD